MSTNNNISTTNNNGGSLYGILGVAPSASPEEIKVFI
jgi:hypothetical protein